MAEFTFPDADMVDQPVLTHGGNAIALSEQIGFRRNARALGLISPLGRALGSDRLTSDDSTMGGGVALCWRTCLAKNWNMVISGGGTLVETIRVMQTVPPPLL